MEIGEIIFLKSLDPEGKNGTIQNFLFQEEFAPQNFANVITSILVLTLQEKEFLINQNIELSKELNELRKTV